MFHSFRQFREFVVAQIQTHQAGDEGQLRDASKVEEVESHVQFLEALKPSFFEIDLSDLVVTDIDLLHDWQLPEPLEGYVIFGAVQFH